VCLEDLLLLLGHHREATAVVPLADGDTATVGGTTADRPEQDRPMGTDADDRLRDLDDDEEDGT
jgi:hypothetical protein